MASLSTKEGDFLSTPLYVLGWILAIFYGFVCLVAIVDMTNNIAVRRKQNIFAVVVLSLTIIYVVNTLIGGV